MKHGKYEVTTLCGSTKFKEEFEKARKSLGLLGHIVLGPETFHHAEGITPSEEMMKELIDKHMQKIRMSDSIYVICPGQYIGSHTMNEIKYAAELGLDIGFSHKPKKDVIDMIEKKTKNK